MGMEGQGLQMLTLLFSSVALGLHLEHPLSPVRGLTLLSPLDSWEVTQEMRKRGQPLVAADCNAAAIATASVDKAVQKELKVKVVQDISKLGKFDPDLYDAYGDAFTNHLGDCNGVQGKSLQYVVRDGTPTTTFSTTEQERMFQILLVGNAYGLDNAT
eukprot:13751400-Ditylum_brightwellii.AAC.1